MELQIDKGVPIPKIKGRGEKYNFGHLEDGDSFTGNSAVLQAFRAWARRKGAVITTRRIEPDKWRCWLIANTKR